MKYFTIKELTRSAIAESIGINNSVGGEELKNLISLTENLLDPLREKFGRPIIVSSGYRCQELNRIVGGAKRSQHLTGQAVDIQSVGDEYNRELWELCKTMDFDQLCDEHDLSWIHISYRDPEHNRHQILKI